MVAGHVVRLGVVGWGSIARQHRDAFEHVGGCRVIAACNRSAEGRAKASSEGVEHTFASVGAMVAGCDLDAVLVTPSIHHNYEVACELIPHGLPILLEKPPGVSLAELRELRALASAHGTPVQVGLNRLHYSVLRRALEDMGGCDAITSVAMEWSEEPTHLRARGFTDEQIRIRSSTNSIHGLSMLIDLAGNIPEPHVTVHPTRGGGPHMILSGVSSRGVLASFVSAWDAPYPWRLVVGAAGRAYEFAPLETCRVRERGAAVRAIDPAAEDQSHKAGFVAQARAFLAVVRTAQVDPRLTLEACEPMMSLAQELREW